MGKRGEVYSTRIVTEDGKKTFFFNVKQNFYKDYYLSVVESRKTETGFRRSTIIIFDNHLQEFLVRMEQARMARSGDSPAEVTFSVGDGRREYKIIIVEWNRKKVMKISENREDSTGSHRDAIFVEISFLETFLMKLRSVTREIEELPQSSSRKTEGNSYSREE